MERSGGLRRYAQRQNKVLGREDRKFEGQKNIRNKLERNSVSSKDSALAVVEKKKAAYTKLEQLKQAVRVQHIQCKYGKRIVKKDKFVNFILLK